MEMYCCIQNSFCLSFENCNQVMYSNHFDRRYNLKALSSIEGAQDGSNWDVSDCLRERLLDKASLVSSSSIRSSDFLFIDFLLKIKGVSPLIY